MTNQKTEIDMRAQSPFHAGAKVARIKRNGGLGSKTGTVERSVVESVITKGKRAGKFRVVGWDGDHEARQNVDGSWQAEVPGSWKGRVVIDDENAAEIERGFEVVGKRDELDNICRDVGFVIARLARDTPAEDLSAAIAMMTEIAGRLPTKP